MRKERFKIGRIPAVLWGDPAERLIIAVHGNMSDKEDVPIEMLAGHAVLKGYQVLSFDLPEHGDRRQEGVLCKVQNCVEELREVMAYARKTWSRISVFANSMGACFSLLAYETESLEACWFLSPVVDMRRLIENMMGWFQITPEQLEEEGEIATPVGQVLYWDYYCYVKEHPVCRWTPETHILYGSGDDMCERDTIEAFTKAFHCDLEIMEGGEHYFHTPEQLRVLSEWLDRVTDMGRMPSSVEKR